MKVQRFEDLRCWQAARELVRLVFVAAKSGGLARDFETKYQLKRAALSSMNNIAEGFGRFGIKDSIRFYNISQSSSLEVKSMSYVLADMEYLSEQQIMEIRMKSEEARNLTLAFIRHLSNRLTRTASRPKRESSPAND
jgi:four helix bundle protein